MNVFEANDCVRPGLIVCLVDGEIVFVGVINEVPEEVLTMSDRSLVHPTTYARLARALEATGKGIPANDC